MIGTLVKENRKGKSLTQKALAEKSGISFVAINRIEKGHLPRVSVAERLFDAMDLQLNYSVTEKPTGGQ